MSALPLSHHTSPGFSDSYRQKLAVLGTVKVPRAWFSPGGHPPLPTSAGDATCFYLSLLSSSISLSLCRLCAWPTLGNNYKTAPRFSLILWKPEVSVVMQITSWGFVGKMWTHFRIHIPSLLLSLHTPDLSRTRGRNSPCSKKSSLITFCEHYTFNVLVKGGGAHGLQKWFWALSKSCCWSTIHCPQFWSLELGAWSLSLGQHLFYLISCDRSQRVSHLSRLA